MSYLGNVVGGDIVRYINLPIADLKVRSGALSSTSRFKFHVIGVSVLGFKKGRGES